MTSIHRLSFMAMVPILSVCGFESAGAQQSHEAPLVLVEDGVSQSTGGQETYGIRPADAPGSSSQSPDASAVTDRASLPDRSPQVHTDGGVRYVSGGVGESGRSELNALSNQFNLHLLFATQGSGDYLAAVRVNILDAHNESVLTAESEGPLFFAQLPPGHYTVEATPTSGTGQDQLQRKRAHIDGARQLRLDFYWR
jgi:hypothetical protein